MSYPLPRCSSLWDKLSFWVKISCSICYNLLNYMRLLILQNKIKTVFHYCSLIIVSWTDQQRIAAAKEGWGYRLVFSARLVKVRFKPFRHITATRLSLVFVLKVVSCFIFSVTGWSFSCCWCLVYWGSASWLLSSGYEVSLIVSVKIWSIYKIWGRHLWISKHLFQPSSKTIWSTRPQPANPWRTV